MYRRRPLPPPTRATFGDLYRIGIGVLMIPLGITILARALAANVLTFPALLMGLGFIVFGGYRVYLGVVRYHLYQATVKRKKKE